MYLLIERNFGNWQSKESKTEQLFFILVQFYFVSENSLVFCIGLKQIKLIINPMETDNNVCSDNLRKPGYGHTKRAQTPNSAVR